MSGCSCGGGGVLVTTESVSGFEGQRLLSVSERFGKVLSSPDKSETYSKKGTSALFGTNH